MGPAHFSGGTSLSKAHGLIQRFSEDIDFKIAVLGDLGSNSSAKSIRKGYRNQIIQAIQEAGWSVDEDSVVTGNEYKFFSIPINYTRQFHQPASLRPHLKAEFTIGGPLLPAVDRQVRSFVEEFTDSMSGAVLVAWVDPVETAADKLSTLTWRTLTRDRRSENDDPTFIRHLHDLAAIEDIALQGDNFAPLAQQIITNDLGRGKPSSVVRQLSIQERLSQAAIILIDDPKYREEYEQFVVAMSYADINERHSFDDAVGAYKRMAEVVVSYP